MEIENVQNFDFTKLNAYDLNQLIKFAKMELEERDRKTKILMKINPKPVYLKPGVRKLPNDKIVKDLAYWQEQERIALETIAKLTKS